MVQGDTERMLQRFGEAVHRKPEIGADQPPKIYDFRSLLLGTKIHIKYGAATFFLYSSS